MGVIFLSIAVVALCMAAMAVGVMVSGRCLRGSCGGESAGPYLDSLRCLACPRRRTSGEATERNNLAKETSG